MLSTALAGPRPGAASSSTPSLYNLEGELADDAGPVDLDHARVRRPGRDVSPHHLRRLACPRRWRRPRRSRRAGIDAEVLDLRTLRPLDDATILASVRPHPPRGGGGRGLAHRQPRRRGERPHHGGRLLRPRRAGAAGVHRRGAHSRTRSTSRTRRCPARPRIVAGGGEAGGRAMGEFRMPSLGADMEAGTLVEWKVKPGDRVKRGDIVAVVETEKGAIDVEVFEERGGDALLVQPGTRVPVGTVLAAGRGRAGRGRAAARAAEPRARRAADGGCPGASRRRREPPRGARLAASRAAVDHSAARSRRAGAAAPVAAGLGPGEGLPGAGRAGGARGGEGAGLRWRRCAARAGRGGEPRGREAHGGGDPRATWMRRQPRRRGRRPGDPPGHRRRHGAQEAGDSPLLPLHPHRRRPGAGVAARAKRAAGAPPSGCCPSRFCCAPPRSPCARCPR